VCAPANGLRVIADAEQEKTGGWSRRASRCAIACGKDARYVRGFETASTGFYEGPHQITNHVVEKACTCDPVNQEILLALPAALEYRAEAGVLRWPFALGQVRVPRSPQMSLAACASRSRLSTNGQSQTYGASIGGQMRSS